jgi:flagellar motor switch protein FliN/FliY
MTTTTPDTITTFFAGEIVKNLPTTKTLSVTPVGSITVEAGGEVISASFVGATSYDIAVVVIDGDAFTGAGSLSAADLIRNAISGASSALGDGVVSNVRTDNDSSLFDNADEDTELFRLTDGDTLVAALAVRRRESVRLPQGDVSSKLSRISGVDMNLTVEIGRTRMPVRDVLNMEPGAIVELDRSAGAPADILLNGRLIAFGEIVVVDQDYAVRVTKILDAQDTVA